MDGLNSCDELIFLCHFGNICFERKCFFENFYLRRILLRMVRGTVAICSREWVSAFGGFDHEWEMPRGLGGSSPMSGYSLQSSGTSTRP